MSRRRRSLFPEYGTICAYVSAEPTIYGVMERYSQYHSCWIGSLGRRPEERPGVKADM